MTKIGKGFILGGIIGLAVTSIIEPDNKINMQGSIRNIFRHGIRKTLKIIKHVI